MTVTTNISRKSEQGSAIRAWRKFAALGFAVAAIFALTLAAPVTIDTDNGIFTSKAANAKNDKDKDNGNGNGNGNGGGNGNSGGKGKSGGNDDTGDTGTNTSANTSSNDVDVASDDPDRVLILLPREEEISMAMFTTRISKRYPADDITSLDNPHQAVSFFSELKEMSGKKIIHRWFYKGQMEFEASFNIRANNWRIWSTKLLPQDMPGEWKVEIVDEDGKVLQVRKLNYAPEDIELLATS
jgi:hypothetical protein